MYTLELTNDDLDNLREICETVRDLLIAASRGTQLALEHLVGVPKHGETIDPAGSGDGNTGTGLAN
jgi:hypothetical protein